MSNGSGGDGVDVRRMVYRFYELSFRRRAELLKDLGLVETEPPTNAEEANSWYRAALNRASKRGMMAQVASRVEEAHRELEEERHQGLGVDPRAVE